MIINLSKLLKKQEALDLRINTEHGVTHQSTKNERFLALLVEIGELANATRVFKYWSLKPSDEREILLDEYADGLHFFLSLALVYGFNIEEVVYNEEKGDKKIITKRFNMVYRNIISFMENEQEKDYFLALESFLSLGSALMFTAEDIIGAYQAKLVVNYARQNAKY